VTGQWGGGFQAAVKITNNSSAAVNGWTLKWTFANGQTITQIWGGVNAQSGANVTITNADYTKTIAASGGSVDFGFLGSWNNSTNAKPTAFTLNGTGCSVS
jgi:mannan endo-1,4-beta-mannosidase